MQAAARGAHTPESGAAGLPTGVHVHAKQGAGVAPVVSLAQDDRPAAVAKQDAGGAVAPIDVAAQRIGACRRRVKSGKGWGLRGALELSRSSQHVQKGTICGITSSGSNGPRPLNTCSTTGRCATTRAKRDTHWQSPPAQLLHCPALGSPITSTVL